MHVLMVTASGNGVASAPYRSPVHREMTLEEFQRLLARPEGETLDFKQGDYDLAIAEKRGECQSAS